MPPEKLVYYLVKSHYGQVVKQSYKPQYLVLILACPLSENIQRVIDALREEGSVKDIKVLRREDLTLQQLPAIAITLRFRDDKSKEWFDKDVNLLTKNGTVYFLELKGNPRDAAQLEVIFDAMMRSLRLSCKA